jgi:hypothetical protein
VLRRLPGRAGIKNRREQFRLERLGVLAQFRLFHDAGQLALRLPGCAATATIQGSALPVRSGLNRSSALRSRRAVASARSE